jgi:nitrogen regulatory protein P-II 1
MELKQIVAVVRTHVLENIEGRLVDMRVRGISVSRVKGFGEFANFLNPDWFVTHARIEIFTEESRVPEIVEAIIEIAHTSMPGDGIVAVLPAEKLYRIRTKSLITAGDI